MSRVKEKGKEKNLILKYWILKMNILSCKQKYIFNMGN